MSSQLHAGAVCHIVVVVIMNLVEQVSRPREKPLNAMHSSTALHASIHSSLSAHNSDDRESVSTQLPQQ